MFDIIAPHILHSAYYPNRIVLVESELLTSAAIHQLVSKWETKHVEGCIYFVSHFNENQKHYSKCRN